MAPEPPTVLPYAQPFALEPVTVRRTVRVGTHGPHGGTRFEVTPRALHFIDAGRAGTTRTAYPRWCVAGLHVNRISGALEVRFTGHAALAVACGADPAADVVMAELAAALVLVPAAPRGQQASAPYAVGTPAQLAGTRSRLLTTGFVLVAVAVACLPILGPFAVYLFVAASVPFGVALGTQRKDYWA